MLYMHASPKLKIYDICLFIAPLSFIFPHSHSHSAMVSPLLNTARNVVGVLGNIISLILFLSPVPTFIGICKKGSVEQYSAAPYLASLINCMVWVVYGLPEVHPHSTLVMTINGTGSAIQLLYIILFVINSNNWKNRVKVLALVVVELLFVGGLALIALTFLHSTRSRTMLVGIICSLFNVMMYASPLSVMKLVITTKSVKYMPFFLSLASLANGVTWTSYAFLPFDPFIAVPNGIGTLLGLAQLILYASYYKSTEQQKAGKGQPQPQLMPNDHPNNNNIALPAYHFNGAQVVTLTA